MVPTSERRRVVSLASHGYSMMRRSALSAALGRTRTVRDFSRRGVIGVEAGNGLIHPVTDRAVGVVIERIHSRTLEAAVGPLAVPPLPDRRRALRHRVGTSIDGVGGAAGRLAAHPQLDGVQVGYETNSKLASEWQLLLSHTPLQSPARRDLAGACIRLPLPTPALVRDANRRFDQERYGRVEPVLRRTFSAHQKKRMFDVWPTLSRA